MRIRISIVLFKIMKLVSGENWFYIIFYLLLNGGTQMCLLYMIHTYDQVKYIWSGISFFCLLDICMLDIYKVVWLLKLKLCNKF